MKKTHKVYDEYNTDLEISDSSPLYKSWNEKWLNYLKNLNGLSENKSLRNIKFNIIEHYTDDGVEKGDFDPSSSKIIGNYQNYKVIDLFKEDYKHLFLEFMNLELNISSIESLFNTLRINDLLKPLDALCDKPRSICRAFKTVSFFEN